MTQPDDHELLAEFARSGSEEAFASLAARHVNLVYSAALRFAGNSHHAQEITQAVFIILARKAKSLSRKTILSGWLYQTARLTAANFVKSEVRRQQREQEAYMQSTLNEPADVAAWQQIVPLLDEAMGRLGETDRNAVVLRFFENKTAQEVGEAMKLTEAAAHKRTARALEKLRTFFSKRGITLSAVAIASTVSANSVQAAPIGLAAAVSTAAAKGAGISAAITALVKGAMKTMAWLKIKFAAGVGLTALVVGGAIATSSAAFKADEGGIAFEVEGTVNYATVPDERGHRSETKHFKVMRNGELWKIRTTNVKEEGTGLLFPKGQSIYLYHEMSFDETNIYRLGQQDEQEVSTREPGFKPDVFALGRVERGDHPASRDSDQLFPIWLAYCSAPYFHKLKGDKAVSARVMADPLTQASTNMVASAKWNESGKLFMKDIEWFSDGTFEAFWGDEKWTIEKYQPPFDKGFVFGRFEVLSWTNWNGVLFPLSFALTGYRPDFKSEAGPRLVTNYTISATLEQIRVGKNFKAIPELITKTLISDARVVRSKGNPPGYLPSYVSTNHWAVSDAIRNPVKLPQDGRLK